MKDGKLHWKNRDLSGQTFGALTAVRPTGSDGKKMKWEFRCSCGNLVVKVGACVTKELRRGGTPNCGCLRGQLIRARTMTHGMSKHPAYWVWRSMRDRCRLPTHQSWKRYGGRGISVCARWEESFENFWEDMGAGYRSGLDLDRINNNAGYSKENCRWTSRKENARNTRRSRIPGWAIDQAAALRIPKSTLNYRVAHGWDVELACTAPPDPANGSRGRKRAQPEWALQKSRAFGIPATTFYRRCRKGWPLEKACSIPPALNNKCLMLSTAARATDS